MSFEFPAQIQLMPHWSCSAWLSGIFPALLAPEPKSASPSFVLQTKTRKRRRRFIRKSTKKTENISKCCTLKITSKVRSAFHNSFQSFDFKNHLFQWLSTCQVNFVIVFLTCERWIFPFKVSSKKESSYRWIFLSQVIIFFRSGRQPCRKTAYIFRQLYTKNQGWWSWRRIRKDSCRIQKSCWRCQRKSSNCRRMLWSCRPISP